jgi:O-antigen polysaccharide polymerase Wzy
MASRNRSRMSSSRHTRRVSSWSAEAWISLLAGLACLGGLYILEESAPAVIFAALLFLICAGSCLVVLRLAPLSPALLYLFVLGVFHLGLALPWALGVSTMAVPAWMTQYSPVPALRLFGVAVWCFHLGATLAVASRGNRAAPAVPVRYHNQILYHGGLAIVAAGLLAFAWGVRSFGFDTFFAVNYAETYRLAAWYDPRFFVTSLSIVPIGFYLSAAAVPWRRRAWVVAPLLTWAAAVFFLGFRGHALAPLAAVTVIFVKRGWRPPLWLSATALALLLAAIPAARAMRDRPLAQRSLVEFAAAVHPLAAFEEMGGSLEPLVHTLRFLEFDSYRMGATYWQAARRVLPNLSLNWQGRTYIPPEELSPTHWVTRWAAPWKHEHFGGLGFSGIAEPYMNFGLAGVAAYFLLLGAVLVWADSFAAGLPTRLALLASVFGPLLWTTRGSFDSFLRPAIWGIVCVLAARVLADSLYVARRPALGRAMARSYPSPLAAPPLEVSPLAVSRTAASLRTAPAIGQPCSN